MGVVLGIICCNCRMFKWTPGKAMNEERYDIFSNAHSSYTLNNTLRNHGI
jgi:hypothetical protein